MPPLWASALADRLRTPIRRLRQWWFAQPSAPGVPPPRRGKKKRWASRARSLGGRRCHCLRAANRRRFLLKATRYIAVNLCSMAGCAHRSPVQCACRSTSDSDSSCKQATRSVRRLVQKSAVIRQLYSSLSPAQNRMVVNARFSAGPRSFYGKARGIKRLASPPPRHGKAFTCQLRYFKRCRTPMPAPSLSWRYTARSARPGRPGTSPLSASSSGDSCRPLAPDRQPMSSVASCQGACSACVLDAAGIGGLTRTSSARVARKRPLPRSDVHGLGLSWPSWARRRARPPPNHYRHSAHPSPDPALSDSLRGVLGGSRFPSTPRRMPTSPAPRVNSLPPVRFVPPHQLAPSAACHEGVA